MSTIAPLQDSEWVKRQIKHGFFSRHGGVSTGLYENLNCGLGSDDDEVSVRENLARVARHMNTDHLVTVKQVHKTGVMTVDARSLEQYALGTRIEADAMVSRLEGVFLGILTADCAPVLFADHEAKIVGAAHAGWRGALAGVLPETVKAMELLGADRTRMSVVIGPCIAQASYAVDRAFFAQFCAREKTAQEYFSASKNERLYFDLEGYVIDKLRRFGLNCVRGVGIDTYPKENGYFSYRRSVHRAEQNYGRQISVIGA